MITNQSTAQEAMQELEEERRIEKVAASHPYEMSHDDIVTFARAMHDVIWRYESEPVEILFNYLEGPHKWNPEYQKWRECGGTLEKECLTKFEHWLDHRSEYDKLESLGKCEVAFGKCHDCGVKTVLTDWEGDAGDPPQAVRYEICPDCYEERVN